MSKRVLVSMGVALGMVAMASFALAGDYHFGQDLICTDCHVMHYSQSHGYNPSGSGNYGPLGAAGPYMYLLRNDLNNLCTGCHDGQNWAPDVVEAHGNGYVRQAGALNVVGGNGQYPPPTGHTLGSTAIAPGSDPAWSNPAGLNCVDCHGPHGRTSSGFTPTNGGYRNLFRSGASSISYSAGDQGGNDLTRWVYESASSGVNQAHYGARHNANVQGVSFNEPDQTTSAYANFCKTCHTNFHGLVGGTEIGGVPIPNSPNYEEFHRHPAGGVNIGAVGGGHSNLGRLAGKVNQVEVMSPTGKAGGEYTTTDTELTPSCFSCHKGHGNQNAFGLIYMVGTGTVTEQGDNGIDARNSCRQCHTQGGAATNPW